MNNQTRRQSLVAMLGGGAFALLTARASAAHAASVPSTNLPPKTI